MRAALMLMAVALGSCAKPTDEAERAVRLTMKDPDSAKFSDWQPCPSGQGYTGKVNGKNSYGAFAGSTDFVAIGPEVALDTDSERYVELLNRC